MIYVNVLFGKGWSSVRPSEQIVADFLTHRGYTDIRYEPDGKKTPDFLVDGRIAIESRILNQNYISGSHREGLQDAEITLGRIIYDFIESIGSSPQGETWVVDYRFSRPVEDWKTLKPKIRAELACFQNQPTRIPTTIPINDRLELSFTRASSSLESFYLLGDGEDEDSDAWILSALRRNLAIIIEEKTKKIAQVRHKYPEWWLVLPDYFCFGVGSPKDQRRFREGPALVHEWDKIILINPTNLDVSFEL